MGMPEVRRCSRVDGPVPGTSVFAADLEREMNAMSVGEGLTAEVRIATRAVSLIKAFSVGTLASPQQSKPEGKAEGIKFFAPAE
jgi:hypothetical protein